MTFIVENYGKGGDRLDFKSSVQTLPEGSALCSLAEGGQIR